MLSSRELEDVLKTDRPNNFKYYVAQLLLGYRYKDLRPNTEMEISEFFAQDRDPSDGINIVKSWCYTSHLKKWEQFCQTILNNENIFRQYIDNVYWLVVFTRSFPEHAEQIFQKSGILVDPVAFKQFIQTGYDLEQVAIFFPEHAEVFLQKSGILVDPVLFRQFIRSTYGLEKIARLFPEHAEELFDKILLDPEEFKRLITGDTELRLFAASNYFRDFPKYHEIFTSPTVADALIAIARLRSEREIKKAARILWIGKSRDTTDIKTLNKEIIIKIAAQARDPALHTEADAVMIAGNALREQRSLNSLKHAHQELIIGALPSKYRDDSPTEHSKFFTLFHGERCKYLAMALIKAKTSKEYEQIILHQINTLYTKAENGPVLPDHLDESIKERLNRKTKYENFKGSGGYHDLLECLKKDIQDFRAHENKIIDPNESVNRLSKKPVK